MKDYLKIKFYQLIDGEVSIKEFEEWMYENSDKLEIETSEEFYIELISFNFKSKFAKQEFFTQFDEKVNWKDYEERRIMLILDSIITKDENFAENLIETYELRNAGYWFLEDLGMRYGLNLIAGFDYGMTSWEEIPELEKRKLVDENYQGAKESAFQVKDWLKNNKVILTGKRGGESNRYIYSDHRKRADLSQGELDWMAQMEQTRKIEHDKPPKK